MNEFEQWQTAWQENTPDTQPQRAPGQWLAQLQQFDRKNRNQMFVGIGGNILTLLFLGGLWSQLPFSTAVGWIGVGCVLLSLLSTFPYFGILAKVPPPKSMDQNSVAYLTDRIHTLGNRRRLTRIFMPLYALVLITGINLTTFELLSSLPVWIRLVAHGGTTLFMLLIFIFGLKSYLRKFDNQVRPIIEQLKNLQQEL